jgi:hypothetical protein
MTVTCSGGGAVGVAHAARSITLMTTSENALKSFVACMVLLLKGYG